MLGLSGEESGLFHIPNKDEKTVNMTEISMKDLFNLPKPSTEELKCQPICGNSGSAQPTRIS